MSNIIYVSPQTYFISDDTWKSDHQKAGYIPILKADLPKLQQALRKLIDTHGSLKDHQGLEDSSYSAKGGQHNASQSSSNENNGEEAQESKKYQPLKQFLPIALEQQLHTISIQGLSSNLSLDSIEAFLSKCVELCLGLLNKREAHQTLIECWTNIQLYGIETQNVFVRFTQGNEQLYGEVCLLLDSIFKRSASPLEFHLDSNTKHFIQDQGVTPPSVDDEQCKVLEKYLDELESKQGGRTEENTSALNYKIDLNTLSDLPSDSLDQLCKDIVDFRTKVVSIEREKRRREVYEESKRRRRQMMRMFEQIRKSRNEDVDSQEEKDENDENEDYEDDAEDDEFKETNATKAEANEDDSVVEVRRVEKEKEESDKRYEQMLKVLQSQTEPKIRFLAGSIRKAEHYDEVLREGRPMFLKELVRLASDPYYDHHRSFKHTEEQKDALDREEHRQSVTEEAPTVSAAQTAEGESATVTPKDAQEQEQFLHAAETNTDQFKIKFAFRKAIEKSADSSSDIDEEEALAQSETQLSAAPLADELPFTQEQLETRLDSLAKSRLVDELVKEHLGVYEDDLVDYILDNIRQNKNKQVLQDELQETFDEDAMTIVNAIWMSEPFLSK